MVEPSRSKVVRWALLLLIGSVLWWAGLRYFDSNQDAAREHLIRSPVLAEKVGLVRDASLHRVRYMNPAGDSEGCFAEYQFHVSGAKASTRVKVFACGTRSSVKFRVQEG